MNKEIDFYDKLIVAKAGDILESPTGVMLKVDNPEEDIHPCKGCILDLANSPTQDEFNKHQRTKKLLGIGCLYIQCRKTERTDNRNIILKKC